MKTKLIYIIGAIIIGLASTTAIIFGLVGGDVIEVEKTTVVFESASATAVYDGTQLTCLDYELVDGTLKEGHQANVVIYGSQTNVGSSLNYMSVTITDSNGTDVSEYYTIETKFGTLTVEKAPLIITSKSKGKEFDGQPLEMKEYELGSQSKLAANHTIVCDYTQNIVNAGTAQNTFSVKVYDEFETDVTANYDISKIYGSLTINPKNITIESASAGKIYDGTKLEDPSYYIDDDALIEGHFLVYENDSSLINVGIITNDFTCTIEDKDHNDVTSNYEITYIKGTLQVAVRTLEISTASDSKIYFGAPLKAESYSIVSGEVLSDDTLTVTYLNSITNVGTIYNQVSYTIIDSEGNDVRANYLITTHEGTLTIEPKEITIVSDDKERAFNGEYLQYEEGDIHLKAGYSLVDGQTLYPSSTNKILHAGSISFDFSYAIKDAEGNIVTDNYKVDTIVGYLTVRKIEITLETKNNEKVYDGTALTEDVTITTTYGEKLADHTLTAIANGSLINFDEFTNTNEITITNTITYSIVDALGEDISKDYNFTIIEGTLKLTKRTLNITSDSLNVVYTGNEFTKESYYLTDSSFAPDEYEEIVYTGRLVNADTVDNEFTIKIYHGTDSSKKDVTNNYDINKVYGKITVSKRQLTIMTNGSVNYYNGNYISNIGCTPYDDPTNENDGIVPNDDFSYDEDSFGSIKYVGTMVNSCTYTILTIDGKSERDGQLVIDNYDIAEDFGEIIVNKVELKVKLQSAEKEYDGTPLICTAYTIKSGNLVGDDVLTFNTTDESQITNVGEVNNIPDEETIKISGSNGIVTDNYDIEFVSEESKLKVTAKKLTIRSKDKTEEYTGTPLTCHEYDITFGDIASTDYLVVTIDGSLDYIIETGAYNTIADVSVYRRGENSTTSLTIKEGETVILTVYDESSEEKQKSILLDNTNYDISLIGFNGDSTKYYIKATNKTTNYTSQGMADSSSFNETLNGFDSSSVNDVTKNYSITQNLGQLMLAYSKEYTGLSEEEEYENEYEVLKVTASQDGPIYLRSYSYTTYFGNAWSKGSEYTELLENKYSYNYLTSAAIAANGAYEPTSISIELINAPYVLPYYTEMIEPEDEDKNQKVQTSDVLYSGTSNKYNVSYYALSYSDVSSLTLPSSYTYSTEEDEYYSYVASSEKYLQITDELKTYFTTTNTTTAAYFDADGNRKASITVLEAIDNVVDYVSSAATYNISYDRDLDAANDKVSAFLSTYKEGVCSHFAEAATMLLRALGIPARYVSGYYAYGIEGKTISITNMKKHAWTEVYLENIGWVQIDATGGGVVKNGKNPTTADTSKTYTVKPVSVEYQATDIADGEKKTITATNQLTGLEELEELGYTYKKVEILNNELTGFGTQNTFPDEFVILDPNGIDVTEKFKIVKNYGKLQIYLNEIRIESGSLEITYDGYEHTVSSLKINDVSISSLSDANSITNLLDTTNGHRFTILETTGSQTYVGQTINDINYRIEDSNEQDVSSYYKITDNYGYIKVTGKAITLEAETKVASISIDQIENENIQTLTAQGYTLKGELADGDYIESVTCSGSLSSFGTATNTITNVVIKNASGVDVTYCYTITKVDGTLTYTIE